jgi:hypothetical protein
MRRKVMMVAAMAIGAMLVATGCGGGSAGGGAGGGADSARAARTAAERCGAGRDSTRAACLAFDTLARLGRAPSTLHLVQHGATFCVHTGPGPRPAAEGEAVVEVVANRVTRVSLSDRAGCGP